MRLIVLAVLVFPMIPVEASASWRHLKAHLNPEATVVRETDEELVVTRPGLTRTIVIRHGRDEQCDIYRTTVFRRGGNPYQIWRATPTFARDPNFPRNTWGAIFNTAFLRILRLPRGPD